MCTVSGISEVWPLPDLSAGSLNALALSERERFEHFSLLSQNWTVSK